MLETLYNYFGFTGSIFVTFMLFMFFVFWVAGIAGISSKNRPAHRQIVFFTLAVLVPVYPVLWLIADMIRQKRQLRRL
jgi:hypothetical protein